MSGATRAKGLRAEREVAEVWKAHGLEVRNLEGTGDHLVIAPRWRTTNTPEGFVPNLVDAGHVMIHSEVKRQERLKLPEWLKQACAECPSGAIPVVSFRQNGGEWYAALRLADLAELVAR